MVRTTLLLCILATRIASAQEMKVYFGLLHGHTSFSDGSGDPDEAFSMGKEAGLDFMAITEHNHSKAAGTDKIFLTPPLYGKLIQSARQHTVPGEFLAVWGQEVSTISAGNHANIFFADEICRMPNGDFKFLYEQFLPAHGEVPFIQFNHPGVRKDQNPKTKADERNNDYGIDDYDGDFDQLVGAAGRHVALVELIIGPAFAKATSKPHQNGKHENDYLFYLNKGFRVGPSVGQDNHFKTWGTATHARMGVWMTKLTPEGFIEAIRERRCYASEDENIEVRFTVNGAMMGSVIPAAETASIKVSVSDDDEPDARYRVQLFFDDAIGGEEAEILENEALPEGSHETEFVHTPIAGGYYFVKIIQRGDDTARALPGQPNKK